MASATPAPAPRAPLTFTSGANKAFNDKVYSRYSVDAWYFVKRVFILGKTDGGSVVEPSRCERHVVSNLMDVYF